MRILRLAEATVYRFRGTQFPTIVNMQATNVTEMQVNEQKKMSDEICAWSPNSF